MGLITLILTACGKSADPSEFDFTLPFENSNGTQTSTYKEVIDFYEDLAEAYQTVAIYEMRETDSGHPLHLVTFNTDRSFESEFGSDRDKLVVLVNNGIHPGESDGIDASMLLMRDLADGTLTPPEDVIIAVIPVYNIGGALNRNSHSRTNQNGPEEYGFRGNARNFDLNRDFIKADSRNARAFAHLFHTVKPDIFIDNHVSNGADYQYVLTHLFTQHNKLGGDVGQFLHQELMPALEDSLAKADWSITPYVNVFNRTPETGFSQFMDYPRYSTGYTTLFNTFGMMVETHMLKPYKQRVEGTYELMRSMLDIASETQDSLRSLRIQARDRYQAGDWYPVSWAIDSTRTRKLDFKGYEAAYIQSDLTGQQRLKYDRDQPFSRPVTYYDHYKATDSVQIPQYYAIPAGYWNVVELLRLNRIRVRFLDSDTTVNAQVYRIADYQTRSRAYEGHYPHYGTKVETSTEQIQLKRGDYLVNTDQSGIRYILETLEPEAPDSFFNWNMFDAILQQKEGFSPYVWEDLAAQFLADNPEIKTEFEAKKASDERFASNWYAQLDWIHKRSPYYEKSHLRYPIVRVGSEVLTGEE
ncbi:hypothetical protein BST85_01825 [Aureitalea marina]|uniref:Uncharacterized protein n=2 Tax=Aureitalea marina TaxID=930804 RepID=A0A2S7KTR0_9FLAO|nr:hypothetical protein BST85_01825 [Aureitalea marina]